MQRLVEKWEWYVVEGDGSCVRKIICVTRCCGRTSAFPKHEGIGAGALTCEHSIKLEFAAGGSQYAKAAASLVISIIMTQEEDRTEISAQKVPNVKVRVPYLTGKYTSTLSFQSTSPTTPALNSA